MITKTRRRPGAVHPTTAKLLAAGLAPIQAATPSPVARKANRYGQKNEVRLARWEHDLFGELRFDIRGVKIGKVHSQDSLSFTPLFPREGEPTEITVEFDYDLLSDVFLFRVQGNTIEEIKGENPIDPLKVSITWKKNGDKLIPNTRQKDADNIDLVLLRKTGGEFIHIQVAVASRHGKFFLTIQDLWGAQAAWDDTAGSMVAIPLFSQNAYQGADYLNTMRDVGCWLLDFAAQNCDIYDTIDLQPAVWQPSETVLPSNMSDKGWVRANVIFFNLIWNGGSGFAVCEDGKSVFIHFKDIVDENGRRVADYMFPYLLAEQAIAVRYEEGPKGRKANAVRVIE